LLFDDHAFHLLFKTTAGSEFNFRNVANQILANFFAVLNFCFFSFKRKEEINKFLVTSNYSLVTEDNYQLQAGLPAASRISIINYPFYIINYPFLPVLLLYKFSTKLNIQKIFSQ
jgi:hypothetical protein